MVVVVRRPRPALLFGLLLVGASGIVRIVLEHAKDGGGSIVNEDSSSPTTPPSSASNRPKVDDASAFEPEPWESPAVAGRGLQRWEEPRESMEEDGPIYNASGGPAFVSSVQWKGKCLYEVTNFCVVEGELTLFHPGESTSNGSGGARGGSLRMCNEFSQHSKLIRLGYRSLPAPAVLPAPLLTKTEGWILQFWCMDLFHMTLSLMPAFAARDRLGEHPDIYFRIAKGKRKNNAHCRIKFGDPYNYSNVRNERWGGDKQFPFAGNPYWPFYKVISKQPWRIHPLYAKATKKVACYKRGVIDKLYIKDITGTQAGKYTGALRQAMSVPPAAPRRCGRYRVTFIDRRGKSRVLTNIPELVSMINNMTFAEDDRPVFEAKSVAMEHIGVAQQISLMDNTDLLIGMHGNGLTWVQFLKPGAVLVELLHVWYAPYAALWGVKHLHSSMKNNPLYKKRGEFVPYAHNVTEIAQLVTAAKAHLDQTSCPTPETAPVKAQVESRPLGELYSGCAPNC